MVLVTGSTGLVGSHLLLDLVNRGYTVKALVRNSSNRTSVLQTFEYYSPKAQELFNKIIWAEGDVTDLLSLEDALVDVEQVYHAAAFISFNSKDKKKIYQTNVEGTANIVNLCLEKKIQKLCFVSSISSLGTTEDGTPITENIVWKPSKNQSDYSKSKFRAEMEVWRSITEGLNAVIVNPSVILGLSDSKTGSSSFFKLISKGLSFYTPGQTGFVDVKDVTRTMIELMESDISGERFVLSAENITYQSFFRQIANALQVKPPYRYLPQGVAEIAWRFEYVRSLILSIPPTFTKNLAHISYAKLSYSSEKVKNMLGMNFTPVERTIKELGLFYQAKSN
jgi:nucleoside-diphosphate-sugar epimerase